MLGLVKAAGALLLDPVALLLVLLAAGAAGGIGWIKGAADEAAMCQAAQLREELRVASAERDTLKARLDTLNRVAASDAARAAQAAAADTANQQAVHDTAPNPRACLDADAARRLRNVR